MRVACTIGIALLAGFFCGTAAAEPPAVDIDGEVVDVHSRWTADRGAIISEVTVRGRDGSTRVVHQLGGTVDGLGMIASHHPPLLAPGQAVRGMAVAAGKGAYMLQRAVVLDDTVQTKARAGVAKDLVARYGINRTKKSLTPLYWGSGCIYLAYDAAGTTHLPDQRELSIADEAAREWEGETSICGGLSFVTSVVPAAQAGRNLVNTLIWREDRWCRPATETDPEVCHNPDAIAVTQVFFIDNPENPRDGEIVEADIEFNGVNFAFTDGGETLGTAPRTADLRSTVTHELGHVLGLTHNCRADEADWPTDHQGTPVPDCNEVVQGSEVTEATMYYLQDPGEVKKATLETSDVLGACTALGGSQCERVVQGGCQAGRSGRLPVGLVLVVGLGVFLVRRRIRGA